MGKKPAQLTPSYPRTLATEQNLSGMEKRGYGISTGGRVGGWKIGFFRPVLTLQTKTATPKQWRTFFLKKFFLTSSKKSKNLIFSTKKLFFFDRKKSIFLIKKIDFFIDKINQGVGFSTGGRKSIFWSKKSIFGGGSKNRFFGPKNRFFGSLCRPKTAKKKNPGGAKEAKEFSGGRVLW